MGTTYKELIRRVFLGFPKMDGEAHLVIKQSINDAIRAIATLEEASSLLSTNLTSADTTNGVKSYHLTTGTYNLGLTRPKDIYSIRLEDTSNSRKLEYIQYQLIDSTIPYPEQYTEDKPKWYTVFGDYIELYPIPDAAYDLYIRYSQWPAGFTNDTDESPYGTEWDSVIVFLSKDIANSYFNGEYLQAGKRAKELLQTNILDTKTKPDRKFIARPFDSRGSEVHINEYWKDPFFKGR